MTSPLGSRLSARPLPLSLVGARVVAIAAAPDPGEFPVTRSSADPPTNPLRGVGGRLRRERRAALGTSAAGGHATSVASAWNLAAFSAARWITIRPRSRRRLRGHVDHYPAAKWSRGTRPLKPDRSVRTLVSGHTDDAIPAPKLLETRVLRGGSQIARLAIDGDAPRRSPRTGPGDCRSRLPIAPEGSTASSKPDGA